LCICRGTFPLAADGAIEAALELGRVRTLLNVDAREIFTLAHGQTMAFGDAPKTDFCMLHPDEAREYALRADDQDKEKGSENDSRLGSENA
jgi:hypothetical protein